MRKQDIVEGQQYVRSSTKDYVRWGGSGSRVVVVSNDTYVQVSRSSMPRSAYWSDEEYVAAHLAWALTEAFPNDTTPSERSGAIRTLRAQGWEAENRWFEADPMRLFRKVEKAPSYSESGCLVRQVKVDPETGEQTLGQLQLCPRRELRDTWQQYAADVEAERKRRAEEQVAQEAYNQKLARERAHIAKLLGPAFEGTGVNPPYLSSYGSSVSLSFEQLTALLEKAGA